MPPNESGSMPAAPAPVQPTDASMPEAPTPEGQPEPSRVEDDPQVNGESQAPQAPEQNVNEGQEAPPSQQPAPPEAPDFDPLDSYGNFQGSQYQFQPNEDGSVDPYQVASQIEANMRKQMQFERAESRAWDKIDKKYGDAMTPRRRELILNARIANAVNGKNTNLTTLADQIMSEFTSAASEGRAKAGISTKVQKAASLESATQNTPPAGNSEARYDRIMDGDNAATTDLLSDWLKEGKI